MKEICRGFYFTLYNTSFQTNRVHSKWVRLYIISQFSQVHHEMAKYHEVGRFLTSETRDEKDVDWESAIFHEEHAADLGVLEAMVTMAKLYLGIERDVLVNCTVQVCCCILVEFLIGMILENYLGNRNLILRFSDSLALILS